MKAAILPMAAFFIFPIRPAPLIARQSDAFDQQRQIYFS
jgi:hypothetical protein